MADARRGIFKTVSLDPEQVVATYYGMLMYDNLSVGAARRPDLYEKVSLPVLAEGFMKWGIKLYYKTPCGLLTWF